jgi:hypothetical protein
MASIYDFLVRNWKASSPPQPPKAKNALTFGILGAAKVAYVSRLLSALRLEIAHYHSPDRMPL